MHLAPLLGIALSALAAGAVAAAPAPVVGRDARRALALTVYNEDLALVRDTRELALPVGESVVRVTDLAGRIDPRTVTVRSLTDASRLSLVEQSSALEPISAAALLERSVGREVELVETDPKLRTRVTLATLLAAGGSPVFQVGDKILLGHPGRIVLSELPADLSPRPTLLWRLLNNGPERHRIEISYLTTGLSWDADYALTLDAGETRADLQTWVTVTNQSGTRYDETTLALVAGQVHRAPSPPRPLARRGMEPELAAALAPVAQQALFEYHLYTLPRPTTLGEDESKQLELARAEAIAVRKTYLVIGQPAWVRSPEGDLARDVPVETTIELVNDAAHNLGQPLPAGTVRLYQRDARGASQLVGEDRIGHTPPEEQVKVKAGTAFDIKATRQQTEFRNVTQKPYEHEAAVTITLRNRRPAPVAVTLREPIGREWKVLESSLPPVVVDAGTLGFTAEVPPNGETKVSYRVQFGPG